MVKQSRALERANLVYAITDLMRETRAERKRPELRRHKKVEFLRKVACPLSYSPSIVCK